jgi:hypothetical protein
LYAEYLRYNFKIIPSPEAVAAYREKILARPYRVMNDAKAKTGGWPNGDLYMYQQCVKFKACGASDEDVKAILHTVTTTEPVLSQSDFPKMTPEEWWNYTAWCPSLGNLAYTDLNFQNLDWKLTLYRPHDVPEEDPRWGGTRTIMEPYEKPLWAFILDGPRELWQSGEESGQKLGSPNTILR